MTSVTSPSRSALIDDNTGVEVHKLGQLALNVKLPMGYVASFTFTRLKLVGSCSK